MPPRRRILNFILLGLSVLVIASLIYSLNAAGNTNPATAGQLAAALADLNATGTNPADAISTAPSQQAEILSDGQTVVWYNQAGRQFTTTVASADAAATEFQAAGYTNYRVDAADSNNLLLVILPDIIFFGLIFGLLYFFLRFANRGNIQAMAFGKSKARLLAGDKPAITFADVAGVDEAKQELSEIVEFLKFPAKFTDVGARLPKGVLLVGPPGTGKTLLSKAVAGEAGVPFFSISGSEFVEMFVGVGASRVRDLFDAAKKNSPCIVFVDEIDAVGRQRGAGLGGGHDEREQTLNQLLVEMDGFETSTHVIIIAATNRPDVLDPALLRPGRFDRHVTLDRPDIRGRKAILEVHARNKPLGDAVDLNVLAKQTPGFSGADLENLINEAAILAARHNRKVILMPDLEESISRVIAGPERRSRLISAEEKRIIAFHETGHALVGKSLEHCDPVHKITIVGRGMALGWTMSLPTEDRYLQSRAELKDQLAQLLGGRAAEELILGQGNITSGASDDIRKATDLAHKMITEWGFSDRLGPLTYGTPHELVFLGRDLGRQQDYSEDVAKQIDEEVHQLIYEAASRAGSVLRTREAVLRAIAARLVEIETMDAPEIDRIIAETEQA